MIIFLLPPLVFGKYFDQEIKPKVLPDSLHTLELGGLYNKKIKLNVLPASLRLLRCSRNVKDNHLPKNGLPHNLTISII